jgi:glutamate/tyrosine decarboxylase-like PLP-dependent enzyme
MRPAEETVRAFAGPTPERGEDALSVLDDLARAAEPGLAGSAGPRFFGWVIGASNALATAADMLTAAWGQNAGNQACSPSAAAAEQACARWLLDILRLPPECSVGFVTGATMASFVGLAAARNAVLRGAGWDVERLGLCGAPPIRVLVGRDAHITILSALRYLGLGSQPVWIDTDAEGRMDPKHLRAELTRDRFPAIVVAQAGQINTGVFDPFVEIAEVCQARGAWLHVDGAFGLWARAASDFERLTEGLELADSWSVDGHKWLQLPYDSGFAIVRDTRAHRRAMSVTASYLPAEDGVLLDPAQFVPELSRRARGFAAWAMIRHLGRRGIADMVRRHCRYARTLPARLRAEPGVRVLNRVDLNQVLVGFEGESPLDQDQATREVLAHLRAANVCLAGPADWRGRRVLRLSVISDPLGPDDIARLAGVVITAWRAVRARHANTPLIAEA